MAREVAGNYIVIPRDKTKEIDVYSQGISGLAYSFTAENYPVGKLAYYEPEGLVAFNNYSGNIEVWKLTDRKATRIHKVSVKSSNTPYGNLAFDSDGKIWGIHTRYSTTYLWITLQTPTKDTDGNLTGYTHSVVKDYGDNTFWDTVEQGTQDLVYVPETDQVWFMTGGYMTTGTSSGYGDTSLVIIYDATTMKEVRRITLDDMGIARANYVNGRNTYTATSYSSTRSQIAYNKIRKAVFIILSNSPANYSSGSSQEVLIGFDVKKYYPKMVMNLKKFLPAEIEQSWYGIECSPITSRMIIVSPREYISINPDDSVYNSFMFSTSDSKHKDITVNPLTESVIVGNGLGWQHIDSQENTIKYEVDLISYHPSAVFVNNPETIALPTGIGRPVLAKSPTSSDKTPNFIWKLRKAPDGIKQRFLHIEDSRSAIINDDTLTHEYPSFEFKYDLMTKGYEYSVDYNEASDTGTWITGEEAGVLCDKDQPDVYVRYELGEKEIGSYQVRFFVY